MYHIPYARKLKSNSVKVLVAVIALSASAAAHDLKEPDERRAVRTGCSAFTHKSPPAETKKPAPRSFFMDFLHYISTMPPLFNLYTPQYAAAKRRACYKG